MIPVRKKPGSFNRLFLECIEASIKKKDPVLILPEGTGKYEFNPNDPLKNGASHVSSKYGLPILPAYLKGCNNWRAGKKIGEILVAFGPHFVPDTKNKEHINRRIVSELSALKLQCAMT